MVKLESADVAAKCVEISKCLIDKNTGLHDYDLYDTRFTGDIARFAANIRHLEIINNNQLFSIGCAIKIPRPTLDGILRELENFSWIEVNNTGGKKTVDENIPPLKHMLKELGEYWEEKSPTDIDRASIEALSISSKKPITKEALFSELNVDESNFQTTLEYGNQVSYLDTFSSDALNQDIVWTPFYWAGKLDEVLSFLRRQSYERFDLIEELSTDFSAFSGKPIELIPKNKQKLVLDGVSHGYFPTVLVADSKNIPHQYVFSPTPVFEADPKKDIFEKARLIVGCIRHGEYHAEISKIKYPLSLLKKLRNNTMRSHSYALYEYAPMITHGICKCYQTPNNRYQIEFNDSEENKIAMDLAEEMLSGTSPDSGLTYEPEVKELMVKGSFNYTSQARQIVNADNISSTSEYTKLMEMSVGVRV